MSEVLRDPARFLAAQRIVTTAGKPWHIIPALPEGEILWHEGGGQMEDWVILTPDGWLAYIDKGVVLYERRVRATDAWVAEIRGEADPGA